MLGGNISIIGRQINLNLHKDLEHYTLVPTFSRKNYSKNIYFYQYLKYYFAILLLSTFEIPPLFYLREKINGG